jgi:hypothetical protein
VEAPAPLPDDLVARLRLAKPDIMATLSAPKHPWVTQQEMRRLPWPAAGWRELHATLLNLWSAPRHDAWGTVWRYEADAAARLAFSDLCDCWRRRHLPEETNGHRARGEAVAAHARFGIFPPRGWEP